MPPISIPNPIIHIQATGGRNKTSKIPIPNPINIPEINFLNLQKNISHPPFIYIIIIKGNM